MAHDRTLYVAQITGRGDRAYDRKADGYRSAVLAYSRSRSAADLAKIQCVAEQRPRLYGIAMITPGVHALLRDLSGSGVRALYACRVGVTSIRHPDGVVERPQTEAAGDIGELASEAWVARLQELGAGALVSELAAVVLHRAEMGDADEGSPDPLGPCGLPSGATLAH